MAAAAPVVAPLLAVARPQATEADLVVLNGRIRTVDPAGTVAQAIAVRDGRIVLVGTNGAVRARQGSATRVIDAGGRTVMPGLIDSHVHALMASRVEATRPFHTLSSVGEIQAWIRAEARRAPAPSWIWTPRVFPTRVREGRFPTREELDAAAPGRAVVVDGSYAFVLSRAALDAARITRDTADPPGAAIVRDADGTPTGLLRNAGRLLARFRPAAAAIAPLDALEALHRVYLRTGITSIGERSAGIDGYRAYEALKRDGRLHVRATVTLAVPVVAQAADAREVIGTLPLKPREGDDRLKVGPLKITVDGGILLGTAFMREPYGPRSQALYGAQDPTYRGVLSMPREIVRAIVAAGHAQGWQMSAHVTGDAGVDVVLDAIDAAQLSSPRADARHTLIHAYFPTPDVARRVAALGVCVDTQPAWLYEDADVLTEALGAERLAHFVGLRTWRDGGARVAINTDHMFGADRDTAMNPFNPFLTMATAVTRRSERGRVVGAGEAVTREQALRMMTIDAAALSFDEGDRGSIEVGKLADLAILSDDPLTCAADRLPRIEADVTIVGGVVVHER